MTHSPAVLRNKLILGTALLALLAGGAFALINHPEEATPAGAGTKSSQPGKPSGATGGGGHGGAGALALQGVEIQPQHFAETIVANGTLRADESVELQTEVNGKIIALNFEEGKLVSAGDVLIKIQDAPLQASRRRALARRELAGFRRDRLANLVKDGGVSQQDFDEAAGEVEVLDAEVQAIEAEIAKTEIRAPFDGVVGLRFVSVGAYVNPATRIATLQRVSDLKVDFSVPERYIRDLKPGSPISYTVAGSSTVYRGEVYAVDPRIDITTRTVMLRAHSFDADRALFPGLFARVEFTVSQDDEALLVPAISVLYGLDERYVYVARNGKATRVKVTLGARTDSKVQIAAGLAAGDVVLTTGIQQLREGLPVTVELVAR